MVKEFLIHSFTAQLFGVKKIAYSGHGGTPAAQNQMPEATLGLSNARMHPSPKTPGTGPVLKRSLFKIFS